MDDPRYAPEKVEANRDVGLRITWADGHVSRWGLVWIRRRCRCAHCNELRRAGRRVGPAPGYTDELDVVDAELVGAYGITFHWTDGHTTGVYHWEKLREGCPCDDCVARREAAGERNPLET